MRVPISYILGFGFLLVSCSDSEELTNNFSLAELVKKGEVIVSDEGTITYRISGNIWEENFDAVKDDLDLFYKLVEQNLLGRNEFFDESASVSPRSLKCPTAYKYQNTSPCESVIEYGWAENYFYIGRACYRSYSSWYSPFLGIWVWCHPTACSSPLAVVSNGNLNCSDSDSGSYSGYVSIQASGRYKVPTISCTANITIFN